MTDCLKKCWDVGELTHSQKESVIQLIAKKGKDQSVISGHRPISLMNYNCKIYAKAIAQKLKCICASIIGPKQLAYVQNRIIQYGHLVISKAKELFRKNAGEGSDMLRRFQVSL